MRIASSLFGVGLIYPHFVQRFFLRPSMTVWHTVPRFFCVNQMGNKGFSCTFWDWEPKKNFMDNLLKVEFTLEPQKMSLGDYGYFVGEPDKNAEEILKKRKGFFHCFGNEPFYDAEAQCLRDRVVGIIQEEDTGKVYHVIPQFITFLP